MYHTVVIGGGCLGASTAISIQRKLNKIGKGQKVLIIKNLTSIDLRMII